MYFISFSQRFCALIGYMVIWRVEIQRDISWNKILNNSTTMQQRRVDVFHKSIQFVINPHTDEMNISNFI